MLCRSADQQGLNILFEPISPNTTKNGHNGVLNHHMIPQKFTRNTLWYAE
jgi:hypothetical protein